MLYLLQIYLQQMPPMDMLKVTCGVKGGFSTTIAGPCLQVHVGVTQPMHPCPLCGRGRYDPSVRATEGMLFEMKGRSVGQDLIPYVRQLELTSVPIKGWIIVPYMASVMVLVMLCTSLPTMEKLSTIM